MRIEFRSNFTPVRILRKRTLTHRDLGIETRVYRIPVLGHFDGQTRARTRQERFDPITRTWSDEHLFRVSITLARV